MGMDRPDKIILLTADEKQIRLAEKMKENMGPDGAKIFIRRIDALEEDTGLPEKQNTAAAWLPGTQGEQTPDEAQEPDGALYVTDSEQMLKELCARNRHVTALLHENNKKEDLSAASYAVTDIEELPFSFFEKLYLRLTGQPWVIMETPRCIIRETTVEDVDAFYKIYAEPSVSRYIEKLYEDAEEEREYTREYIRKIYGFYGYGLWTVTDKQSGEIVGRAGLSWRAGFDLPELGFVIAAPYQRKGYAFEVCSAILAYGRTELRFEQIQALIQKENEASLRLCRRMGLTRLDTVEDRGMEYERYVTTFA